MKQKRYLIFVIFFGFLSFHLLGQALNFSMAGSNVLFMNAQTNFIPSVIKNLSSKALDVDIVRILNDRPVNWHTGLCAYVCQPAIVDSMRIQIPAYDSVTFKMYFTHIGGVSSDTAHTKILFRNVSNPTNFFLQDYYATYNLVDINEESNFLFKVFPNPASNYIAIEHDSEIMKIDIIDIMGKRVKLISENLEAKTININVSDLPKGIYFIHINALSEILIKKVVID